MGDEDVGSTPSSATAESPSSVPPPLGMTLELCRNNIQKALHNPKVKTLMESMEKSGCKIGENFFKAKYCRGVHAGHFSRGRGIGICCNYMGHNDYLVQAMIHELIHAYDDCRAANMKWDSAAHQACSEIRANHLSGDCHIIREFLRGNLKLKLNEIKAHEPKCVKNRAARSVAACGHSPATTEAAIEGVWDTCYNDKAPFDPAP
ncbi:mitochondrial inner membrane protease ATP23-like isoform X1 [Salvia miltiorrhiza]|uniref:mitochondrial inner membrane protease ATP23-like isoform X1 n=1 Tax=Salvia miltiorrhiza TaxID=226208 RepID=UPI0025ABB7A2|nr:mitochondrial inner membrane protease ATP23-like isoform X1 [Salvia miltiorrhiza]XP_057766154.1 mitochondrial inner membrane protease ATP23-like isoform X1 [Salvia miltiorrhiza]